MQLRNGKQVHNDSVELSSDADDADPILYSYETVQRSRSHRDYREYCAANGLEVYGDRGQPTHHLHQRTFDTWDIDPPDFPGLNHFSAYINFHEEIVYGRHYEALPKRHQEQAREMLNAKFAHDRMAGKFEIGQPVGNCYTITSKLADAEGSFNRGIFIVEDKRDKGKGILKLLPSSAMNHGYAEREIGILARLDHKNIVALHGSHIPTDCHETPWIITDFCEKGTLKDMVLSHKAKKQLIPELFAWQIFESLVQAVVYCRNGDSPFAWDEITHRDIILSNIFIKTDKLKGSHKSYEYPLTVKLGDWGCAITSSEWSSGNLDVWELPLVEARYAPAEEAVPEEATDVYQIGVVMWCLFCLKTTPAVNL
jgi:serine/threonine protein kinase